MLLYITNIPALFAMTVHHKTLEDLTTEEFYNYALHWFMTLSYVMQEAIFWSVLANICLTNLDILHRSL